MSLKEKEIVDKYILITYDLPYDRPDIRAHFIREATRRGFVLQSESCYFGPLTPAMKLLAEELATVGEVYLWYATLPRENQAKAMTAKYDTQIHKHLEDIKERLNRMMDYRTKNKEPMVEKMKPLTDSLISSVETAIKERGNLKLLAELTELKRLRGRI